MSAKDHQTLRWLVRLGSVHQSKMRPRALRDLGRAGFLVVEKGIVRPTEDGICYAQASALASA